MVHIFITFYAEDFQFLAEVGEIVSIASLILNEHLNKDVFRRVCFTQEDPDDAREAKMLWICSVCFIRWLQGMSSLLKQRTNYSNQQWPIIIRSGKKNP